jgi:hypothetical protein
MPDHFIIVKDGALATLTFNRPEKRNPLNEDILLERNRQNIEKRGNGMCSPNEMRRKKNHSSIISILAMLLLNITPRLGLAQEQEVIEVGKREFQHSCATCHGATAKGDGPSASTLNVKPADLTRLSKKHGGVFLFWRVYEKINGRDEDVIRGHGTREMPIWGERFHFERDASEERQAGVRGRILSLVFYLQSIQEK